MKHHRSVLSAAIVLCAGSLAVAQEPSARERQLEELVRKLAEKVDRLEARLNELDGSAEGLDTKQRVEKLERTVQEIKNATPPDASSEEWSRIKKWASDDSSLRPYWKDGLRLDSNDGSFKLKIGGRIQHDFAFFTEGGDIEHRLGERFDDGSEFRRARLYFSGTIYDNIDFKVQYDFAGGDADFKDVYVGLGEVPYVGNVRVGHFKEPFGLEQLASSNDITFMERSLINTSNHRRSTGVMIFNDLLDGRLTWAAGVFFRADDFGDSTGEDDYNVTARVTGLPWYSNDGRELLHLGIAFSHQNYEDERIRFRQRPEAHLAPRLADTGNFAAEYGDFIGVEAAWVAGPFSLQGEYVHSFIEGRNRLVGDPNFWAASIQASYFLTGEHRPYETSSGTFGLVRPLRNFRSGGGPGAWELAARLSYLTLNDGHVHGGRLRDLTVGVNWYLNPNLRTMWNYVLAEPSEGGSVNAFMWRVQMAF